MDNGQNQGAYTCNSCQALILSDNKETWGVENGMGMAMSGPGFDPVSEFSNTEVTRGAQDEAYPYYGNVLRPDRATAFSPVPKISALSTTTTFYSSPTSASLPSIFVPSTPSSLPHLAIAVANTPTRITTSTMIVTSYPSLEERELNNPPLPLITHSPPRRIHRRINPENANDPRTRAVRAPGSPQTEAARCRNAAAVRRFREKRAGRNSRRVHRLNKLFQEEYQMKERILKESWEMVGARGMVGDAPECWNTYIESVKELRRMEKQNEAAKEAGKLTTAERILLATKSARKGRTRICFHHVYHHLEQQQPDVPGSYRSFS